MRLSRRFQARHDSLIDVRGVFLSFFPGGWMVGGGVVQRLLDLDQRLMQICADLIVDLQ